MASSDHRPIASKAVGFYYRLSFRKNVQGLSLPSKVPTHKLSLLDKVSPFIIMAKENEALDESFDEIEESDDTDWKSETIKLREKAIRQREKTKELREQLKEREAKLSEFEKNKKETKSDPDLLKRLDTMALRVSGIQAEDEVELFNKWKEQTGRDADAIIGSTIFQKELADLRTAKANAAATDLSGKGGAGGAPSGGTLEEQADYWIGKSSKDSGGEPLFPEEMPNDYKLYAAIVRRLQASSKENKRFYNS